MNHIQRHASRSVTTGLVVAALLAGAAAAVMAGASRQTAQQPLYTQHAVLTHHDASASAPNTNTGYWVFEDANGRYDAGTLYKLLGIRGTEPNRAIIINAVAAKGWELVNYTDAPVHEPDINNGSTNQGRLRRTEQWWFRKR